MQFIIDDNKVPVTLKKNCLYGYNEDGTFIETSIEDENIHNVILRFLRYDEYGRGIFTVLKAGVNDTIGLEEKMMIEANVSIYF